MAIKLKKLLYTLFIFFFFLRASAWCADIVIVQSAKLPAYNNALTGFESIIFSDIQARGHKAIQPHTLTSYILSEIKKTNQLRKEIIQQKPDLLLVIGSSSLSLVKGIRNIPVVYIMVPYPELVSKEQNNITGINLVIPAELQLRALINSIPNIKDIGMLYDPNQTHRVVTEAAFFAKENNLSLTYLPVETSKDVPAELEKLRGKIDCFWMVPDRTVITPQTLDHILLFSLENRIPVLTFSEKYLDLGAALSVSFDPTDMGKQAGEMALEILDGANVSDLPPQEIRKVKIKANHLAAKILGLKFEQIYTQQKNSLPNEE